MPLVLGYHGCDFVTAQKLLGGSPFLASSRDYDWLGHGIYFWENDLLRAHQWAKDPRRKFEFSSVVGAVIELGNCLDLTTQTGLDAVKVVYKQLLQTTQKSGRVIPENANPPGTKSKDRVLRYLDCAVINHLFELYEIAQKSDASIQQPKTVRALFPEGDKLYPGAGFLKKTHVQICVREPQQILGVFRVSEWQREELVLPDLYK